MLYFKPLRLARNMPSDSSGNGSIYKVVIVLYSTLDYRILTDNVLLPSNVVWPAAYDNYYK